MPVMMVAVARAGHLRYRHDAAFQLSTTGVLKLNGGMGNLKVVLEHVVQLQQDARAL
jgi:hypothetical protein